MKKKVKIQPFIPGIILSIIIFFAAGILHLYKTDGIVLPCIEILMAIFLSVYYIIVKKHHAKDIEEYIHLVTTQNSTMANDAISRFPLATVILRIDGRIMWYNDLFSDIFESDNLYEVQISSIMPELKWSEILKASDSISMSAGYRGKSYDVMGNIIASKTEVDDKGQPIYSVLLYFLDKTETIHLKTKYENEKTDVAIINIDNFDDIFQKMDDDIYQNTVAAISRCVSTWVAQSKGVLKKTERDRYIAFFEHKYLDEYIKTKFDLLAKIHAVGEEIKTPITVSIGIGTGGHVFENEAFARAAIDMALGRGGDQAAVKDSTQYKFYGGTTKDYEKSTRVKARAFAVALKDFIAHADNVIFMGHSGSDFDSMGAALGLQRAVRSQGKTPYIIYDGSLSVRKIVDSIRNNPEYDSMLINPAQAEDFVTPETLLIILDTHRPSMLPCPELLNAVDKIVLIDHHRRSTEFIENISLTYHEPYASSTCEMATEIMEYIDTSHSMNSFEAMALYIGILMDTKNFLTKTGVRTFEAASFLKRYGLDTAMVKQIFNVEKDEYMRKLEIVKTTQLYNGNIAIAHSDISFENIRAISSQAADDMLNIAGTKAAFVIYPIEENVYISARSLGDVNVQLIMEKLSGGGHMTAAGTQLKNTEVAEAENLLKQAIDQYIEEQ